MDFIVVADWYQEYSELINRFPELTNFNIYKCGVGDLFMLIHVETLDELRELGKLAINRDSITLEFDKYRKGNNYLHINNVNR